MFEIQNNSVIMQKKHDYPGISSISFTETKEVNDDEHGCVRLYCTVFPEVFNFQIRAHQQLSRGFPNSKLRPRNLIATVSLTLEDLEEMIKLAREEIKNH